MFGSEAHVQPGKHSYAPFVDSPYGRISASIGFDYDFMGIWEAYVNKATLMLQPAYTWGPIGPYVARTNKLRSVENGFTTFRCAK